MKKAKRGRNRKAQESTLINNDARKKENLHMKAALKSMKATLRAVQVALKASTR